jgi:hypothetical protein
MDTTDALSIIAIVVASVAFFVAVSQVLQQYFATAEGYRRCQYSVMGQWSGFTYRKFRWSEFRFETRFTTPHIRLGARLGESFEIENGQIPLLSSTVEIDEKKHDLERAFRDAAEWVCWVQFVEDIEAAQNLMIEEHPMHAPALKHRPKDMASGKTTILPELKFGRPQPSGRTAVLPASEDLGHPSTTSASEPRHGGTSSLHKNTSKYPPISLDQLQLASCALRNQSWDFMPPEALKPLASALYT